MKRITGSKVVFVLSIISTLLFTGCPPPYVDYKISSSGGEVVGMHWRDSLQNVKIYLEVSLSMKGYVNLQTVSDAGYVIKRIVPYLITDCGDLSGPPELWTISISPERYSESVSEFNENLRNGDLMQPGNSELHKVFKHLIEANGQNEISFLVTDCIPDLNNSQSNLSLDEITTSIDKVLAENPNISTIVYQYLSEFNGDWYYDQRGGARPFQNQGVTLHDRPLYVWMFGRQEIMQTVLNEGLFKDTNRYPIAHSYNYGAPLKYSIPFQLFDYPMTANAFPWSDESVISIRELSPSTPITMVIGMNLDNLPHYAKQSDYLSANISFNKAHLNVDNIIEVFDQNTITTIAHYQEDILPSLSDNHYTHFLKVTIGNLNLKTDLSFGIVLNESPPDWIDQTDLHSDLYVSPAKLENKTFAFKYITDGFEQGFRDNESKTFFELNFSQNFKY